MRLTSLNGQVEVFFAGGGEILVLEGITTIEIQDGVLILEARFNPRYHIFPLSSVIRLTYS